MKLTVLGPGCWGLTLAWLLNNNFEEITIWGRECDLNEDLIVNKFAKFTTEAKHEIGWTDWIKSTIKKSIDEEKPTRQIIQESLADDGEKIQKNPIINKFLNNMGEFNPNAAPEVREEFFGKDNFFKDATLYLK